MNGSTSGLDDACGVIMIEDDVAWLTVGVNIHTVLLQKGDDLDQHGGDNALQMGEKSGVRITAVGMGLTRKYASSHRGRVEENTKLALLIKQISVCLW